MRIKDSRKLNLQNPSTDTKCFIKHQNKKFIISIQNNITWAVLLQIKNENLSYIQPNKTESNKLKSLIKD